MQQGNDSFRLIVRRGPQPNQTYDLNKDIITIGRDITNDIVINDPEVSRHHLRFSRGARGYSLEDLGSTNGTFINGQRLSGAKPLNNGDMLGLGETVTLGYEMVRMPSSAPPEDGGAVDITAPNPVASQPPPQQPVYTSQPPPEQQADYGQQPAQQSNYGGAEFADAFNSSPPSPQPPAGGYYEEYDEPGGNNTTRIVLIGCVSLLALCCCATIASSIYIDSQCLWWDLPVIGDVLTAIGQEPSLGFDACLRRYG
jgi:pSer/pThr/pTyr-binding forkhead associated (FHA) protein